MMMHEDTISQTPDSEPWCLSVADLPMQGGGRKVILRQRN